ncbi:hypothetical protein [Micromonospora sp. NPDC005652]|uniref:hypothetical protein n=1 Tax=Micromonospora sp. NPDC005652 TaxID=3157046 RepID=UPI0033FF7BF5
MQFDDRQLTARLGVTLVDQLAHGDHSVDFRELQVSDVGVDGHIEQRVAGKPTGRPRLTPAEG